MRSKEEFVALAERYRTARDEAWKCEEACRDAQEHLRKLRDRLTQANDASIKAYDAFAKAFAAVLEGEQIINGVPYRFPHCDQYVLHAPGQCKYCDDYPTRQAKRVELGINFTGEHDERKIPCPAEMLRPETSINRWHGNRPVE